MRKVLFSLIILIGIAGCSDTEYYEPIDKTDGVATLEINLKIILHEDYEALAEAWDEQNPDDPMTDEYTLEGFSDFIRREDGTADCWVNIVEPQELDGEHTLTLGHEVLHCVYGLYHDE